MAVIRDLLVHVGAEHAPSHAFEWAAALAAERGARLGAVLACAPVQAGLGLSAETAALAQRLDRERHEALQASAERLASTARQRHGLEIGLRYLPGDPVAALQAAAGMTDLLVLSQSDPQAHDGLSSAQLARLVVGAAGPVLLVPHIGLTRCEGGERPDALIRRVLVAWSATRECARALRDALPLLCGAAQVELLSLSSPGAAHETERREAMACTAAWLSRHGVACSLRLGPLPAASDVPVAEMLLSHAAETGADLIVMGGYGHSRLREFVMGGVTRTMLATMTVPVLMSH